ncbi:hypothetical protein TWF481_006363 [Arthrobotrys musiformis]|uniref:CHAT domain-containing protein n=1 Tax=Arthrobotrys musiformis TaxID=47236 RepID=A0AAV9WM60_9PEZI
MGRPYLETPLQASDLHSGGSGSEEPLGPGRHFTQSNRSQEHGSQGPHRTGSEANSAKDDSEYNAGADEDSGAPTPQRDGGMHALESSSHRLPEDLEEKDVRRLFHANPVQTIDIMSNRLSEELDEKSRQRILDQLSLIEDLLDSDLNSTNYARTEVLDMAIDVRIILSGYPDLVDNGLQGRANRFRDSLTIRFKRTENPEDIKTTICSAQSILPHCYRLGIDRAELSYAIGELFLARWEARREKEDIDSAIEVMGRALRGSKSCSKKGEYLLKLVYMLKERFRITNETSDLDKAIRLGSDCVNLVTMTDREPTALRELAICLQIRYQKEGNSEDMERAIDAMQKALDSTTSDPANRQRGLMELGRIFYLRYYRTRDNKYLDRAIEQFEQSTTMGGDVTLSAEWLNFGYHYLGICYHARYRLTTGLSSDLDQAVEMATKAVRAVGMPSTQFQDATHPYGLGTGQDATFVGALWFTLASYLYQRSFFPTRLEDLQRAIDYFEEASKIPGISPDYRCMILCQLGDSLVLRFGTKGTIEDLTRAESVLKQSFETLDASPTNRASSARSLANKLAYLGRWEEALVVIDTAVSLLAVATLKPVKDNAHSEVEAFASLSRDAAAIALNAGRTPLEALVLLDRGLGLLSGSTLTKNRSDPEIVKSAHSFPSYSANDMMDIIGEDKLVVVNVSKYRCDAILVEKGRIELVPLTLLDQQVIDANARTLRSGGESSWGVLEWLWEAVALPILREFKIYEPLTKTQGRSSGSQDKGKSHTAKTARLGEDQLPHIWWITTGQLTQLPIHAAGKHFERSNETVLDCTISSYSDSVKCFIERRREAATRETNLSAKALVVSMPKTPGYSSLSFAEKEATTVTDICRSLDLIIQNSNLRRERDEVLEGLRDCQIFHFAGHGFSDPTNPSQSRLLLHDWRESPLTVEKIQALNLQNSGPFLAYLSACSTGSSKIMTLSDENIHLVNAFQAVGFQNVVGTLWEVNDRHCVGVAKTVYETIAEKGLSNHSVALGLHRATVRLRNGAISNKPRPRTGNCKVREPNLPSGLNSITVSRPGDHEESCIKVTKLPKWLYADLKSYRLIPLRLAQYTGSVAIPDKILSLPLEVITVRQIPLQFEPHRPSRNADGSRGELGGSSGIEYDPENSCENEAFLRDLARVGRQPVAPQTYWIPYVHFGI